MSFKNTLFFAILSLILTSNAATAIEISGTAKIIDGDTLSIGNQVIRLYGIDAPENAQDCQRNKGKHYNCGAEAVNALKELLQNNAVCAGDEFDSYRRLIAICHSGSTELNRTLVRSGYALAYRKYSTHYIADETMRKHWA